MIGADRVHGGRGAGKRRDAGHLLHHRHPPDELVVEKGLAAERRVYHELDRVIQQLVADVRAPLVHVVAERGIDAVRADASRMVVEGKA